MRGRSVLIARDDSSQKGAFMQAVCALVAIAMVHSDNRLASIIAMGIFATGVATPMLLILAHD
jgi:hypothetical protein